MMVPVFVDTSALMAVLAADDKHHRAGATAWLRLLDGVHAGDYRGVTHYGVVLESSALVQRRLGMAAAGRLHDDLLAVLALEWVDEALHTRAMAAMVAAARRDVSLVDWTSFEMMRAQGIEHALAFDSDFDERGFGLPWA